VANSRSARKRIRSNERKRIRNRTVRSAVRTKVARARRSLLTGGAETAAPQDLHEAIRALDRAAEKGILHENNARRRKSRLARMAARLAHAAAGAEGEQAAARAAAAGGAKGRGRKTTTPRKVAAKAGAAAKAPAAKSTSKATAGRTTARGARTDTPAETS